MELFEAIKDRRSVRRFKPDHVSDEDLNKILRAGISAPSAGNRQSWEFVIVRDPKIRENLSRAAHEQNSLVEAPVVIVICADAERSASRYGERGRSLYSLQDTAAAAQNILLAAYELGYGTCWVGAFDEGMVAKTINAPACARPVILIPLGRPAEKPLPTSRLSLDDIMRHDGF